MKLIVKTPEPKYLLEHRRKVGTDYDSFKKDVGLGEFNGNGLRKSLLDNQGYICAYCMKRIPHKHIEKDVEKDDMKIEHWLAQTNELSKQDKLDITYTNMFGCCMGNEGKKEKLQTCDTKKGSGQITINPTIKAHIDTLNYAPDGSLHSIDGTIENDIQNVLNLNEDNLKRQREAIYRVISSRTKHSLDQLMTRKEKNAYLTQQITWWLSLHAGKYEPFCMVAVKYLESRIK